MNWPIASVFIAFLAAAAALYFTEVWRLNVHRKATSALIWRLKDKGRLTGPEAGKLLSALYGDK